MEDLRRARNMVGFDDEAPLAEDVERTYQRMLTAAELAKPLADPSDLPHGFKHRGGPTSHPSKAVDRRRKANKLARKARQRA